MPSKETMYFDRPGPVNTEKTLALGIQRALDLDIEDLVVPSITGQTALRAAKKVKKLSEEQPQIVCVTFRAGGAWDVKKEPPARHWKEIPELKERWERWREKGMKQVTFDEAIEDQLNAWDVPIVQATDVGASVEASMTRNLGVSTQKTILKETLYLFCPGVKVSVLTTVMAADAGTIPVDQEVIAFGGTEQGVDTAVVLQPAYSDRLFSPETGLEIREILCKPRSMRGESGRYHGRAWKQ